MLTDIYTPNSGLISLTKSIFTYEIFEFAKKIENLMVKLLETMSNRLTA